MKNSSFSFSNSLFVGILTVWLLKNCFGLNFLLLTELLFEIVDKKLLFKFNLLSIIFIVLLFTNFLFEFEFDFRSSSVNFLLSSFISTSSFSKNDFLILKDLSKLSKSFLLFFTSYFLYGKLSFVIVIIFSFFSSSLIWLFIFDVFSLLLISFLYKSIFLILFFSSKAFCISSFSLS